VTPANFVLPPDDPESFVAKIKAAVIFTCEMAGMMVRSVRRFLGKLKANKPSFRKKVPRLLKKPNRSVKLAPGKRRAARSR
jgi:hypothetical protein